MVPGAGREVETWRPAVELGTTSGAYRAGMGFARALTVLHVDALALPTPQLPARHWGGLKQFSASAVLHLAGVAAAVVVKTTVGLGGDVQAAVPAVDQIPRHIVFVMPDTPRLDGGGGGGNRGRDPIRRAQALGEDAITLRVRETPPPTPTPPTSDIVETAPQLPAIVLAAKPMASGVLEQIGLPVRGVLTSPSTGAGTGGGVGSGSGSGIGSGRGPGLGPGSGGGAGGGVYRAGGAVTAPRLIASVKPEYTSDALSRRLQGSVVLEVIVTATGCTSQIRVVKSLDRGGLDDKAIAAVAQWQFEPGRLAGDPVDVLVRVVVDFRVW
jgi:TonB family protein